MIIGRLNTLELLLRILARHPVGAIGTPLVRVVLKRHPPILGLDRLCVSIDGYTQNLGHFFILGLLTLLFLALPCIIEHTAASETTKEIFLVHTVVRISLLIIIVHVKHARNAAKHGCKDWVNRNATSREPCKQVSHSAVFAVTTTPHTSPAESFCWVVILEIAIFIIFVFVVVTVVVAGMMHLLPLTSRLPLSLLLDKRCVPGFFTLSTRLSLLPFLLLLRPELSATLAILFLPGLFLFLLLPAPKFFFVPGSHKRCKALRQRRCLLDLGHIALADKKVEVKLHAPV
mmetsp:Transcript_28813/g.63456  ORF Transcript_28813/g.63456 Transcript_28813/m.63456 type:complete len:288 (-) Transcript_28813:2258-3121(-)